MQTYYIIATIFILLIGATIGFLISKTSSVSRNLFNKTSDEVKSFRLRFTMNNEEKQKLQEKYDLQIDEIKSLISNRASLESEVKFLGEKLLNQKTDLNNLNERFLKEFETLAGKTLKSSTDDFRSSSSEMIKTLLNPFNEQLKRFEGEVKATRENQIKNSAGLQEQIKNLMSTSNTMMQEASNLTNALKGDSKMRGNWGEMILESILTRSGLQEGDEYSVQKGYKDEEGRTLKPDVIVNLPGEKNIVVDSKVQLVAYESYINEEDELIRENFLKQHIAAIHNHINDLSGKRYDKLYGINSPDFVLMFFPIEPAYTTALEEDINIFNRALEKGVLPVTPTTLISTLKIIYSIWRQEKQNQNAAIIAETAGKLYDKLYGFISDMEKIDKSLKDARLSYDNAYKKLSTGKGNALDTAEKMKELGAKAKKSIENKTPEELKC